MAPDDSHPDDDPVVSTAVEVASVADVLEPPGVTPPVRAVAAEVAEGADHSVAPVSNLARVWWLVCATVEGLFGIVSLIGGLALLATVPVLNLMSLGYLLEVSGRVARTGRLRDGLVGVRKAARVGGIVLGTTLVLLPLALVSEMWARAELIDPGGPVAGGWRVALIVLTVVLVGHLLTAWWRGGRLRHFFLPAPIWTVRRLIRGGKYVEARDAVWDFVVDLRLPYYFWLGLRGFAGAVAWIFIPVAVMILGSLIGRPGPAVLVSFLGGLMFAAVILYLPFMQTHFAAEGRLVAMFELGTVRRLFCRAPIAFWMALLVTLLFALPLYLLKIELLPREVEWLPAVVFVVFIYPARLLTGWAMGRARHHEQPRFFLFRWAARLAAVPLVLAYVFIVYFTQFVSWYGSFSLLEQHAFLVPVPFLGL